MAFKLSKAETLELAEHKKALADGQAAIEDEMRVLSEKLAEVVGPVNDAIRTYNEAVQKAQEFVTQVAVEHRDAFDEKSESWQQNERGENASAFIEAWEGVNLREIDEVDLLGPDEPSFDDNDLDELPEEADQ